MKSRLSLSFSSDSSRRGAWVSFEVVGSWDKSRLSLRSFFVSQNGIHKVSVMAKQKKERECFYHHIISKKWALEQVFLEFSVRASSFSATARKQALRVNSPWRTFKRHKRHLDENSSVLGCTLYGLVCHYQSYSQDWAEDQRSPFWVRTLFHLRWV